MGEGRVRDGDCRGSDKDTRKGDMDRGRKGKRVERDRKERNRGRQTEWQRTGRWGA